MCAPRGWVLPVYEIFTLNVNHPLYDVITNTKTNKCNLLRKTERNTHCIYLIPNESDVTSSTNLQTMPYYFD